MNDLDVGFMSLNELHREVVCEVLESIKAGLFFSESEAKKERLQRILVELLNRLTYLDLENGLDELMKDRYFRAVYSIHEEVKELEYL